MKSAPRSRNPLDVEPRPWDLHSEWKPLAALLETSRLPKM